MTQNDHTAPPSPPRELAIVLKPVRIALALSAIVVALTVANSVVLWIKFYAGHDTLHGLTPLFDFNREGNLPAFYSACALLLCAVLFGTIAGHAAETGDRWRPTGSASARSSCSWQSTKPPSYMAC